MIKKGDITRAALLKTAKTLFSEKGYSAVTMKDFCVRNGLSRGGLYRHFASTKEIFIAMLDFDRENSTTELDKAISDRIPAKQMFNDFISKQKQDVQNGAGRMTIAIYEFCITETEQKDYMDKRFAYAVEILAKLIHYGQSQQGFRNCDSIETARSIVIFLEGLKISSTAVCFTETMLDEQLKTIYKMVVGNDE